MRMYEAEPGHWLCEGVTMAEHEAAMADNYTGEDYYDFSDELLSYERRRIASEKLKTRDAQGVWVTRNGRALAIKDMADSHRANALAMLERNGYDARTITPNLYAAGRNNA